MSILSTSHLCKEYGSAPNIVRALDDVSLAVEPGEFVCIIGTSGSGKSTLLNMLGGLDRPSSGSVTVDGQELGRMNDEALTIFRRRNIGFIFQNYNEPTGNLDSATSDEVLALLGESSRRFHQTIVMITHDPQVAARADRTIRIEDGRIVAQRG